MGGLATHLPHMHHEALHRVVLAILWSIWKSRNIMVFDAELLSTPWIGKSRNISFCHAVSTMYLFLMIIYKNETACGWMVASVASSKKCGRLLVEYIYPTENITILIHMALEAVYVEAEIS
jgi:hypothetical protein